MKIKQGKRTKNHCVGCRGVPLDKGSEEPSWGHVSRDKKDKKEPTPWGSGTEGEQCGRLDCTPEPRKGASGLELGRTQCEVEVGEVGGMQKPVFCRPRQGTWALEYISPRTSEKTWRIQHPWKRTGICPFHFLWVRIFTLGPIASSYYQCKKEAEVLKPYTPKRTTNRLNGAAASVLSGKTLS